MSHLHEFLQQATPFLQHYGLWALFLALFLETFGVPAPGETLLIAASLLASKGDFPLWQVICVGWVAAVAGDNTAFYVGHFGGRRLLLRLGGRLGLTHERLSKVEHFYERYGAEVVIVARFFEGARQLNGLVAGSSGMAPLKFFIYNVIGAGLWVGFWATAAFYFGDYLGVIMAAFGHYFLIVAGILLAALLIYFGWKRWGRKADGSN